MADETVIQFPIIRLAKGHQRDLFSPLIEKNIKVEQNWARKVWASSCLGSVHRAQALAGLLLKPIDFVSLEKDPVG